MNAKVLLVRSLVGCLLAAVAVVCTAESPQRKLPAVRITPEMILQSVSAAQQQSSGLPGSGSMPYSVESEYQPPKNIKDIPNGCAQNQASLCYDYRSDRAMYKPMRKLLPALPGMTPHNFTIHRDKIVAEYSFK